MTETLRAWIDRAFNEHTVDPVVPLEARVHGIGTDIEHDLLPLWAMTVAARPRVALELGTRRAVSTRTLAHACQRVGAFFATCDPDPACRPYLRGVKAAAFMMTSERLYDMGIFPTVDLLFVDTDPHSAEQTLGHLDTWVARSLTVGGLAIFHDVNARDVGGAPRPDIQVREALDAWMLQTDRFERVDLGHDGAGGLGVLRKSA